MNTNKPPVITIVGPTASGKTSLSIALARTFNGEIISADSRQVYRGMDLGSGKVTFEEMAGVRHHLIDIVDPANEVYTGADFFRDGTRALIDITTRGKLPIIAGGTFFYLDLLKGVAGSAPVPPNPALRAELEALSIDELNQRLQIADSVRAAAIDTSNPRRLVRALEIIHALGHVPTDVIIPSPYRFLTLGIDIDLETLMPRITERLRSRIEDGMIEEVTNLHGSGVTWKRLDSFGLEYRYISKYLQGSLTLEAMTDELAIKIRQFAKRQLTWLKRDTSIVWLPFPVSEDEAKKHIEQFLSIRKD